MYRYFCAIEVSLVVEVSITHAINANDDDCDEASKIIAIDGNHNHDVDHNKHEIKKHLSWTNTLYTFPTWLGFLLELINCIVPNTVGLGFHMNPR